MILPYIHNGLNYGSGVWRLASAAQNAVTVADGVTVVEMGRPPHQGLYRIVMQPNTELMVDVPGEHQHLLTLADGAAVVEYADRSCRSETIQLGDTFNLGPHSSYTITTSDGAASLLVVHGLNSYTLMHAGPDDWFSVWRRPLL